MSSLDNLLPFIFLITTYLLVTQAEEPSCTSDSDFANCVGNTANFCPKGIECGCKDGKPFCKCPYYRGQWGSYWYIGPKCDQLWNTLDLIVIAVLPGVGLAFVVAVIAQAIHYCKNKKSNKNVKQRNRNQRTINEYNYLSNYSQHNNLAYMPEHSGAMENALQPQQTMINWTRPIFPLQKTVSQNAESELHQSSHTPGHVKGFNYLPPQLKTVPVLARKPNAAFTPYVQHSKGPTIPDEDYEDETPSPEFGPFPRVGLGQSIKEPAGVAESQWSNRPYGIERSQQPYPYRY
uniref:Uncharacterized protein LOC117360485 n=1 Tax=Geotrypetes seraphini TaxID=260995 RepID=A0A6P8QSG9_GEOSA|nr:uncharacterized protein LOC117360485 [Geotrypetes seraphini]